MTSGSIPQNCKPCPRPGSSTLTVSGTGQLGQTCSQYRVAKPIVQSPGLIPFVCLAFRGIAHREEIIVVHQMGVTLAHSGAQRVTEEFMARVIQ